MENTPTAAELKRRGAAAIENGLKRGPIHLMKRNKAAAVVVSESETDGWSSQENHACAA
ncbi:MAG: hypothetical protein ACREPL_05515 [Rhodanobacteraceae bacterium]